jgi:phosphonoacetate hydrolase
MTSLGASVGITADHGMNDKVGFDGQPRIVYLRSALDQAGIAHRCVLPITDPYLAHHASLGGYATIYIEDKSQVLRAMEILRDITGCYAVVGRTDAVKAWDLPADRIGDIVVVGDHATVLGSRPEDHDLTLLRGQRLRSHGGMDESTVPMYINQPLKRPYMDRLNRGKARNYHLFEYLLNGIQGTADVEVDHSAYDKQW